MGMVRKNAPAAVLLLVAVWILFYNLGTPNFYQLHNESRRALIVREMIDTGGWLIPQLEGEVTLTKPPLFYWSMALCSLRSGVTELTARMPSAVAGLGTVLFTLLIGTLLFGRRAGCLSAAVLITTNFFMHQARFAELESMLAFFATGAVYFFLKGWGASGRRMGWFALFFLMMGLGLMTKGPFALTFPLIPIVGSLLLMRQGRLLRSRAFLAGLLPFLMVVLPWPVFVLQHYPGFFKLVLWETVLRAATGFVHQEAVHYYVMRLAPILFPWIVVLPFAVWHAARSGFGRRDRNMLFVVLWFLGNLVFLSLLRSKRDYYLFPIMPSVALLVGATWRPLWRRLGGRIVSRKVACLRAAFMVGVVCAGASLAAGDPFAVNIPGMHAIDAGPLLLFVGLVLMAVACAKSLLPAVSSGSVVFASISVMMLLVHFVYFTCSVPILNVEDSGRFFYQNVARIVPPGERLGFSFNTENYTFVFYARRPLTTITKEKDLAAFMAAPERTWLVMRGKRFRKLAPLPWRLVARTPYAERASWKGYVLLCNDR